VPDPEYDISTFALDLARAQQRSADMQQSLRQAVARDQQRQSAQAFNESFKNGKYAMPLDVKDTREGPGAEPYTPADMVALRCGNMKLTPNRVLATFDELTAQRNNAIDQANANVSKIGDLERQPRDLHRLFCALIEARGGKALFVPQEIWDRIEGLGLSTAQNLDNVMVQVRPATGGVEITRSDMADKKPESTPVPEV
jgi:hypothetical protein